MSTLSRDYEYGRIVSVDVRTLGDNLAADVAAGSATLTVEDAYDFDETGGQLVLGGVIYAYTAVDDETGTITLTGTTAAAAVEGDAVDVYDPTYLTVSTEKVAQVEVAGDDGNVDMLECLIAMHLTNEIAEGVRGGRGESVKLELDGPDWVVVDTLGLASTQPREASGGVLAEQDGTVATTVGVTQSILLKHLPILNSEHVYWNGVYQPGSEWTRYGQIVAIPDPDGLTHVGDDFTCEYLYTQGTDHAEPGGTIELVGAVWYGLDVATHPGTGFDLALPAGTQAGDLLCLVISSWVEPAFSPDARFLRATPIEDDVVVGGDFEPSRLMYVTYGFEDGSATDVHVELGLTAWRGVAIVAFRGASSVASEVGLLSIGGVDQYVNPPPSPATRYIAITGTISGTVGDNIDIPASPAGAWVSALRDRANKAGAMVCYTPDPAPEVASLAGGIQFAGGVGGGTGFCGGVVLGIR